MLSDYLKACVLFLWQFLVAFLIAAAILVFVSDTVEAYNLGRDCAAFTLAEVPIYCHDNHAHWLRSSFARWYAWGAYDGAPAK